MFNTEDAVSIDTTEFELAAPGEVSQSPGVVLAINEGPPLSYYVRVWLPLGTPIELSVTPDRVGPPHETRISSRQFQRGVDRFRT